MFLHACQALLIAGVGWTHDDVSQKKAHHREKWLETFAKLAVSFNIYQASPTHEGGMISSGKILHPL